MAQRLGRATADGNGAAVGTADAVEGEDAMQRAEAADATGKTAPGKAAAEKTVAEKTDVTAPADATGNGRAAAPPVTDRARSVSPEGSDGRRSRGWRRRRRGARPAGPAHPAAARAADGARR